MRHPHLIPLPSRERKSASSLPVINPLASVYRLRPRPARLCILITPKECRIKVNNNGPKKQSGSSDEVPTQLCRKDTGKLTLVLKYTGGWYD